MEERRGESFFSRVWFFIVKAAIAISSENPATPLHAERIALSREILQEQIEWSDRFSVAVVTNATILSAANLDSVPDGDVEFVVNSVYNAFLAS
jgi:hypothetical protein